MELPAETLRVDGENTANLSYHTIILSHDEHAWVRELIRLPGMDTGTL